MSLRDSILERARELGFGPVGVASVEPSEHMERYDEWIENEHHGSMAYMARADAVARRRDLRETMEGVRSAVVVAENYFRADPPGVPDEPDRAVTARYARGADYHRVMEEKLEGLLAWIRRQGPDRAEESTRADSSGEGSLGDAVEGSATVDGRIYVDTGPILERELARRAGLGWFGKNTLLLHPRKGSYFFLGVLLLDLELEPTGPFEGDHCGTCTRCVEACPTEALLGRDETGAPIMDARRCISYLTIENRGPIPPELRPLVGNRVFGCDICQEVCPFNVRFAEETEEEAYSPRPELDGPRLVELAEHLLPMSEKEFLRVYADSPVSRARRKGLLRNVCVGLGNWVAVEDDVPEDSMDEAEGVLIRALNDDRPLVRGHAAWALGVAAGRDDDGTGRNISAEMSTALRARIGVEEDEWVRGEIERALSIS